MDGAIEDIDAWAALWEYSYQALCVRGRGKHTLGHKYYPHEPELQPEVVDGPIDHPILAVDSTRTSTLTKIHDKQRALMLPLPILRLRPCYHRLHMGDRHH
jgi:hypothetical protein